MEPTIWQDIERLIHEFQQLGISQSVDYEKYYLYSLITHSTAIEGSTLTETDTQLLFDEGVTAQAKPLVHQLMNEDLKKAYDIARQAAGENVPITPAFLCELSAAVMHATGSVHHAMGGSFDSTRGEYRLCGVTAGAGGRSYMNYQKVPDRMEKLCSKLQQLQSEACTMRAQYELSFNAHLNLVTIHPWVDGNGRMARLLMNYIQYGFHLFPTKVFIEDRAQYILALQQSQDEENKMPFIDFMTQQLYKSVSLEIERYKSSNKKSFNFLF
jgi:Fic family protein